MSNLSTLSDFLAASGDIAYEWDLVTDQITWYGATATLFGTETSPPEHSQDYYNLLYPDDRHLVFGNDIPTFDRQFRVRVEGGLRWVQERGSTDNTAGHPVRQRGILRILDQPMERVIPPHMQDRDPLTGCFNRVHMLAQIATSMIAAKTSKRIAAYIVLGIDKMSFVNEAVGMEVGDALLRNVAERLAAILPTRAILGRVGGDMFGILLPEPIGVNMTLLANRIVQSFRDHPVVTSVTELHITVSIGGVRLPAVARNATEAMIFAEQAMHQAHQKGRNLFIEYLDSPERTQENRQLLELGERIQYAFKHDGFRLAYQPVIETETGRVLFYEALVRMFTHDGAPISAAVFVPLIEQMGLASDLDKKVLDIAVKELTAYPALCLAINVSGLTASQADWPDHLQKVLGDKPDVAQRMIIEITETAAMGDINETRRFVERLRALGGRVALDDFGAGFTSINYLRTLSLSIMKIDKELLAHITTNAEQQHLVRMLIELARGLGLKTVAEGVETEDVADWLRREKADMMQGYYFGKPALDRPWLSLKGAESPVTHASEKSGLPQALNGTKGPTTLRASALI